MRAGLQKKVNVPKTRKGKSNQSKESEEEGYFETEKDTEPLDIIYIRG